MTVFDEILEGVEHRFCLRHLYNNFKKRFGGGVVILDLMMGVAKATFYQAWEKKWVSCRKLILMLITGYFKYLGNVGVNMNLVCVLGVMC